MKLVFEAYEMIILVVETKKGNISVNKPEDVIKVEAEIKKLRDK
jgi:hypothetical protein